MLSAWATEKLIFQCVCDFAYSANNSVDFDFAFGNYARWDLFGWCEKAGIFPYYFLYITCVESDSWIMTQIMATCS